MHYACALVDGKCEYVSFVGAIPFIFLKSKLESCRVLIFIFTKSKVERYFMVSLNKSNKELPIRGSPNVSLSMSLKPSDEPT